MGAIYEGFETKPENKVKYFKINGIIEVPDNYDLDFVSSTVIDAFDKRGFYFGGGIKETNSEGEEI